MKRIDTHGLAPTALTVTTSSKHQIGRASLDTRVFEAVNRMASRTPWLHGSARLVSEYGIIAFAALLVIAWWQARRHTEPLRKVAAAIWAGTAPLIALGIAVPISSGVGRDRPFVANPDSLLLIHHGRDFGFPSDHATAAGAVAIGLLIADRRLGVVAAMGALMLAVSRVYVGVHYPGDVLGGLALGGFVSAIGARPCICSIQRLVAHLARSPLRAFVTT